MRPPYRDATLDDLPAILAIYNSTIASRQVTADLAPVTAASRRAWFDAHGPQTRPLWVVERAGRIVAWLSFTDFFYDRPAYRYTAEISIYLEEAERGRGLGAQLLDAAIAVAPTLGINTALGLIFGHNVPSLRLFERAGFERWGLLPRIASLDSVERDLVIVGKRFGAIAAAGE